MSDADATDPVKALREFTALGEAARHATTADMQRMAEHQKTSGFGRHATALDLARAALYAAPALLARIEAGEADRKDILDRIAATPLDYASAYETLKDIARDYEVGVYAKEGANRG